MPLRVTCGDCGKILYDGPDVKSPFEVTAGHDGKCPGCKKRLAQTPQSFTVKPTNSEGDSH